MVPAPESGEGTGAEAGAIVSRARAPLLSKLRTTRNTKRTGTILLLIPILKSTRITAASIPCSQWTQSAPVESCESTNRVQPLAAVVFKTTVAAGGWPAATRLVSRGLFEGSLRGVKQQSSGSVSTMAVSSMPLLFVLLVVILSIDSRGVLAQETIASASAPAPGPDSGVGTVLPGLLIPALMALVSLLFGRQ
ncbi:hypothetical protein R1sor_013479 [Riccia sorocarpa]|uniref:Uncharacterized protein n=1 Tax=Riccia sorocarpa TaxID=122646 RepID=A0ABD3HA85_9MARC